MPCSSTLCRRVVDTWLYQRLVADVLEPRDCYEPCVALLAGVLVLASCCQSIYGRIACAHAMSAACLLGALLLLLHVHRIGDALAYGSALSPPDGLAFDAVIVAAKMSCVLQAAVAALDEHGRPRPRTIYLIMPDEELPMCRAQLKRSLRRSSSSGALHVDCTSEKRVVSLPPEAMMEIFRRKGGAWRQRRADVTRRTFWCPLAYASASSTSSAVRASLKTMCLLRVTGTCSSWSSYRRTGRSPSWQSTTSSGMRTWCSRGRSASCGLTGGFVSASTGGTIGMTTPALPITQTTSSACAANTSL